MQHAFNPGQIILDKYRIERTLGAGGMGVVVAARHLALDQLVAIKFMLGVVEPIAIRRFVVEARIGSRLRSQHVARVLDVDALEGTTPYMVLEFLEGKDLAALLHERGSLPIEDAVDAMVQACEALAEAHALGIIHRDLKPANMFMTRAPDGSPCVKVIDFGIAKLFEACTQKLDASQIIGSAPYMAPEQIRGETLDARTDVWALGATLFHLLTGSMPFAYPDAITPMMMITAVITRPPKRARDLRPELPAALEAVLLRCLEKEPAARFWNVAELAAALAPFGSEHSRPYPGRIARILGVSPLPSTAADTAPLPTRSVAMEMPPSREGPGDTASLPERSVAMELPPSRAVPSTTDPISRDARRVHPGVFVIVLGGVVLLGAVGILARRSNAEPGEAKSVTAAEVAPAVAPTPETTNVAARSSSTPDTPVPVESTTAPPTRSAQVTPRRVPSVPPSKGAPSTAPPAPPPKEELYGRRR